MCSIEFVIDISNIQMSIVGCVCLSWMYACCNNIGCCDIQSRGVANPEEVQ